MDSSFFSTWGAGDNIKMRVLRWVGAAAAAATSKFLESKSREIKIVCPRLLSDPRQADFRVPKTMVARDSAAQKPVHSQQSHQGANKARSLSFFYAVRKHLFGPSAERIAAFLAQLFPVCCTAVLTIPVLTALAGNCLDWWEQSIHHLGP